MTTPERFRRRQRIEGGLVLLLAVATILMGVYFHGQDQDQRSCFADKFGAFTTTMQARGALSDREFAAIHRVLGQGLSATTQAEFQRVRADYFQESARINKQRAHHPIPPFPNGTCE